MRKYKKKVVNVLKLQYQKEPETITLKITDKTYARNVQKFPVNNGILPKMRTILVKHLEKYALMTGFTLVNFLVTNEMLLLLRELLSPLTTSSPYLGVIFRRCEFECSANQLFQNLNHMNVTGLHMECVELNRMRIATMHLSLIPVSIAFSMNYTYEAYESEVDDQILTNWLYKMPKFVGIRSFSTKITLNGVLTFIEKLNDKLPATSERRIFHLGKVKADEDYEKQLTLAIRNSSMEWTIEIEAGEPTLRSYTAKIDGKVEIEFYIPIENYPRKVTRKQVSDRIQIFRAIILEKLQINPLFTLSEDKSLMLEMNQLLEVIYDEWTDLKDELRDLPLLEANEVDEQD